MDQQEFDVFLDGGQFAGILLRHGARQVAAGQALGDGDDILNGIVQNTLGSAHGVADAADLILRLIVQGMGQVALAEGHHSLFGLPQGSDNTAHHVQVQRNAADDDNGYQHAQDNHVPGAGAANLIHLIVALRGELGDEGVAGADCLVELGGALVLDQTVDLGGNLRPEGLHRCR